MRRNQHVFAEADTSLGRTDLVLYIIKTDVAQSIRQAPSKLLLTKQEAVGKMVKEITEHRIIEKSNIPWSSPVL